MGTTTLRETFDDETYSKLLDKKGGRTWQQAIIEEFGVKNDE